METPIKRIGIVGPECTGKSSLGESLAEHYKTVCVPEYARGYLDNLTRPYNEVDLLKIAHGQARTEEVWLKSARTLLFCDTTLLVLKIWSEYKFKQCDPFIADNVRTHSYDLYLLTYIDVPWENDPQREHPDKREELYSIYVQELKNINAPYIDIRGTRDERKATAIAAINKLLTSHA